MINTERLYPILLRSNLPRETLGQLWALCNKTTPGQLIKEELFLLLAMISIAQVTLSLVRFFILKLKKTTLLLNVTDACQFSYFVNYF